MSLFLDVVHSRQRVVVTVAGYLVSATVSKFEVLAQRLIGRGTDSEEVIQTRLSKARHEIEQSVLFDYVVVNDDLDRAEADLFHIIKAGRLKKSAQQGFISNLLENS